MPKRTRSKLLLRYGMYCVLTESHLISNNSKIWLNNLLQVITFSVDTMMAEATALLTSITKFVVGISTQWLPLPFFAAFFIPTS